MAFVAPVFHGSNALFTTPRVGSSETGFGFFMVDDWTVSEQYGQHMYAADVTLRNPLVIDAESMAWTDLPMESILKEARADGHDGVVFKDISDQKTSHVGTANTVVAFDAASVRLVSRIDRDTLKETTLSKSEVTGDTLILPEKATPDDSLGRGVSTQPEPPEAPQPPQSQAPQKPQAPQAPRVVSKLQPPRPGLVPQSGDWNAPDHWVRPEDAAKPGVSVHESITTLTATQSTVTLADGATFTLPNTNIKDALEAREFYQNLKPGDKVTYDGEARVISAVKELPYGAAAKWYQGPSFEFTDGDDVSGLHLHGDNKARREAMAISYTLSNAAKLSRRNLGKVAPLPTLATYAESIGIAAAQEWAMTNVITSGYLSGQGVWRGYHQFLGHDEKTIDTLAQLLDDHGQGGATQDRADATIHQQYQADTMVGQALRDQADLDTHLLEMWSAAAPMRAKAFADRVKVAPGDSDYAKVRDLLDPQLYRAGKVEKPVESWTTHAEGASPTAVTDPSNRWAPDKSMPMTSIRAQGFKALAGVTHLTGAPGEGEVLLIRESGYKGLDKANPPRPGLVPQSGDWEHPVRWIRPGPLEGASEKITPAAVRSDPKEMSIRSYHGTSSAAIASIKKHGLIVGQEGGGDEWIRSNPEEFEEDIDRPKSVYTAYSVQDAVQYSKYAAKVSGGTPVVLRIEIPLSVFNKYAIDDETAAGAVRFERTIPPEWITILDDKIKKEQVDTKVVYAVVMADNNLRKSSGQPPRPGLIPQSGDWENPDRWIRPEEVTTPEAPKTPTLAGREYIKVSGSYTWDQPSAEKDLKEAGYVHAGSTFTDADPPGYPSIQIYMHPQLGRLEVHRDKEVKNPEGKGWSQRFYIVNPAPDYTPDTRDPLTLTSRERLSIRQKFNQYFGSYDSKERWEKAADTLGVSIDEVKAEAVAYMKPLIDKADVWMRMPPSRLASVLKDGRFKPLAESGRMGPKKGITMKPYMEARDQMEEQIFGIPQGKAHPERPIYGYLSDSADGHGSAFESDGVQALDVYGTAAVKFKPSVRERTSFTVGDSLDMNMNAIGGRLIPSMLDDVKAESTMGDSFARESKDPSVMSIQALARYKYTEAQVHGGANVNEIDEVVFHKDEPSAALANALRKAGIRYRIIARDKIGKGD